MSIDHKWANVVNPFQLGIFDTTFVSKQAVAYEAGGRGGRPPPAWKIQGKLKLLKNPEWYRIFQCSEKFQGKLCFSGQAQVVQNSE